MKLLQTLVLVLPLGACAAPATTEGSAPEPTWESFGAELAPDKLEDAVRAVLAEVDEVRRAPVPSAELAKAVGSIESDFVYDKETVQGYARSLGFYEVVAQDYRFEQRYLDDLRAVTADGVRDAARRYLDGEIAADAAAEWLSRYAAMDPERAAQRVRFIDKYRSYVINYNLGQDLVRRYIEAQAGDDPTRRWEVFEQLLSSPRLPSDLL